MNQDYRNDFTRRVNAARTIREPRYGRTLMISHETFERFETELREKLHSAEISYMDFVNCRAFIGEAVNIARRY